MEYKLACSCIQLTSLLQTNHERNMYTTIRLMWWRKTDFKSRSFVCNMYTRLQNNINPFLKIIRKVTILTGIKLTGTKINSGSLLCYLYTWSDHLMTLSYLLLNCQHSEKIQYMYVHAYAWIFHQGISYLHHTIRLRHRKVSGVARCLEFFFDRNSSFIENRRQYNRTA